MNVDSEQLLLNTCRRCYASLFTDRAISYREDKGFDHFDVALSIGVQTMVRSDSGMSGVMFSIDTETGFSDAVLITAAYGLGENVVQGAVNPDEYYVFKPTLKSGFRPILRKRMVVQARPETIQATRNQTVMETYHMKESGPKLVTGRAVGERIGHGTVRIVRGVQDLQGFQNGDVLVSDKTDPDWEPTMKKDAAIVTNRGGRTCHAAIVSRELGLPAVVGAVDATSVLKDGQQVTVCCAEGETGCVYDGKLEYVRDEISISDIPRPVTQVLKNAAAFYPKPVILRCSDFKTNEYANLLGGSDYEPTEENPMIGFRGASRYYDERYADCFALECEAIRRVREDMGLTNLKVMIPFCRTPEEGRRVIAEMDHHGLCAGENELEIYVMCEIPSNVICADQFAEIFDGFSIGSNDLTQLTLGVDRDSEIVSHIFDERNDAVKRMITQVIRTAKATGTKIGICGQAPRDYPEFAEFLVQEGIDSISLNPDTVVKTTMCILEAERALKSEETRILAAGSLQTT